MSEEAVIEVRKRLERSLQRRLPESVWEDLVAEGYVRDYLRGDLEPDDPEENWRELRKAAVKRLRFADRILSEALGHGQGIDEKLSEERSKKPKEKLDPGSFVGPRTAAMARAMTALFALLADQYPEVEEFRDKVLGEKFPLSPEEAHAFIASYANRILALGTFAHWGIPIIGHRAEILDTAPRGEKFNPVDDWMKIRVDPPGITKTVRYAYPREGDSHTRCVTQSGAVVPVFTGLPIESHGEHVYPSWLWPGSVVDNLYELSEELANAFDWPASAMDALGRPRNTAAAWFVLTGEAPELRPLDGGWEPKTSKYFNPQWRIRLTIPPWVPAEEVSRAYQLLRGQIPKGRELPKKTKILKVARFVWEQERLNGYRKPPPWRAWCERWNAENPKDRFKDYRHFRTNFFRGDAAVKELNFNWPQPNEKNLPDE